jgi:hypothetical protein
MAMTEKEDAVTAAIEVGLAGLVKDNAALRASFDRQVSHSGKLGQAAVDVPLIVLQHGVSRVWGL